MSPVCEIYIYIIRNSDNLCSFPTLPFFHFLQKIKEIPAELKPLYKTVWELSQKTLIDMCADRGAYIDQSQSFNVHIADPNFGKLTSMHFYAWKKVSLIFLKQVNYRQNLDP